MYFIGNDTCVSYENLNYSVYTNVCALVIRSDNYWKYIFLNISSEVTIESDIPEFKGPFPKNPLHIYGNRIVPPIVKVFYSEDEPCFYIEGKKVQLSYSWEQYVAVKILIGTPVCSVSNVSEKYSYNYNPSKEIEIKTSEGTRKIVYSLSKGKKHDGFYLVDETDTEILMRFVYPKLMFSLRMMCYKTYLKLNQLKLTKYIYKISLFDLLYAYFYESDSGVTLPVDKLYEYLENEGYYR